jgi:membrane-bound lytic murein transglycosylase B
MIDRVNAIMKINPDAKFAQKADGSIEWLEGTAEISKADIEAKMTELQAEYDALAYARARKQEYPNVDDFMEAYTEKEIGGNSSKWDEYVIKYNKVRSDNPKL